MRESEALEILERLQGSEIRVEEAAEALRPAAGWDPEEPELPKRLRLDQYASPSTSKIFAAIVRDDVSDEETLPLLAAIMREWLRPASRLPVLEAMVAAYNREREEEEFEAQAGPALTAEIENLCREAVDRVVQKGVLRERARCLGVFDWLLSVIPQGWDFVRRYTEAARRKLESGEIPRPAGDWPGADDDQPPEAPCGEWPISWDVIQDVEGARAFYLNDAALDETRRRWEAEPKLRLWKNVTAGLLETERKVRERLREERDGLKGSLREAEEALAGWRKVVADAFRERDEALGRVAAMSRTRILTGKES